MNIGLLLSLSENIIEPDFISVLLFNPPTFSHT
nr:MAG TPA: hypothetical protein [Caudoviricetes sp.]